MALRTAARVTLARQGWTQETFRPGQNVTIKGSPARREENVCYLTSFIGEDGREVGRMSTITSPVSAGGSPGNGAQYMAHGRHGLPAGNRIWRGSGWRETSAGAEDPVGPGGRGGPGSGPPGRGPGGLRRLRAVLAAVREVQVVRDEAVLRECRS